MKTTLLLMAFLITHVTYAGTPWVGDMEYVFLFLLGLLLILIGTKPTIRLLSHLFKTGMTKWHGLKKAISSRNG